MTHRTRILLWTDTPAPYAAAIAAAGLDARVQLGTLPRQQQPDAAQLAETEVILGWGAPAGLLPRMPVECHRDLTRFGVKLPLRFDPCSDASLGPLGGGGGSVGHGFIGRYPALAFPGASFDPGDRAPGRSVAELSRTRFPWTPICPRRDRNDHVQHEKD